jgi:putative ABC transport system permease protein
VDLLRIVAGTYLPRLEQIVMSVTALMFNGVASLVAVVAFGLAPAITASRGDVCDGLRAGAATGGRAPGSGRLRAALITTEVGLSLVLLVAGGLVLRTVYRLQQVDLGFRPDHIVVARTEVAPQLFRDPLRREAFYRDAIAAVRALPEVDAVALGHPLPLEGVHDLQKYAVDERSSTEERVAARYVVSPGYFQTMGIRVLAGRDFSDGDGATHRPVVIVDAMLARELWPGEAPVGRRILLDPHGKSPVWADVIGVVGHTRADALRAVGRPQIHVPYYLSSISSPSLVIATHAGAVTLAPLLKQTIERLGGHRPVHAVLSLESYVTDDMADGRFALFVFGLLAAIGLVIAAAGLYSVVSYATAQRTHEIGVRIALGARASAILGLVVGQSVKSTTLGVLIGVGIAALLTRYLQSLLFEISPLDPLTFGGVALILLIVALAASYFPARRALRVDPMIALRAE